MTKKMNLFFLSFSMCLLYACQISHRCSGSSMAAVTFLQYFLRRKGTKSFRGDLEDLEAKEVDNVTILCPVPSSCNQ